MTQVFCVLALLAVANSAPLERTFHLNAEAAEPVELAADAVVAGAVKTHVSTHALGSKTVEVAIKKVAVKPAVVAAPHVHGHAHPTHVPHAAHPTHAPHAAHPTHAPHAAHPTHAPHTAHPAHAPHPHAHAHGHDAVTPAAPLAVVLDNNPILVDKDKITAILKQLLSGAINKVDSYGESPSGKPVAVVFSAAMHVVDLATLKPLVSAQGAALAPSYEPTLIKVEVAKLAKPYGAPAPKPHVAPAGKPYAAPAAKAEIVVVAPAEKPYAAPAAKAKTVVVAPSKYAPPVEYVPPAPEAEAVVVESQPAYEAVEVPSPAEVYTAPLATPPPPPPAVEVPLADYAAPAEVEVAAVDAAAYPPAPLPLVKKVKKVVVANDVY